MPPPYNPVGRCIYCGVPAEFSGPKGLNDEHIIPYSIGGESVLPQASCCFCSDESHAFEGRFANMLEGPRAHFHWQSRKRKRPSHLEVWSPSTGAVSVPISDHPPSIILPLFQPPGILSGRAPDAPFKCTGVGVYYPPEADQRLRRFPGQSASLRFRTNDICRTLAKIAHAFTVAELTLDGFDPLLTDIIFEKTEHYGYLVGNGLRLSGVDHSLHKLRYAKVNGLIVVAIRLYAKYQTPPFAVVSGRLKP